MVTAKAKSDYTVRPLTQDRWTDLETVFGASGGYCGCWCMYWREPRKDYEGPARKEMKARFKRRVSNGPPPGLIAYSKDGEPVGWAQVTPRPDVPNWNGARRLSAPADPADAEDGKVWALNCFVIRRDWRRRGVSKALLAAAIADAKKEGARALDACPVEAAGEARPAVSLYHGTAAMFARAGFAEIARRRDDRPLMRFEFKR